MEYSDMWRSTPTESRPLAVPFTSRFHTTPRLRTTDPTDLPALPRATVANLSLPTASVQERAATLVEHARATGRGHSLRLWRQAVQTALQEMAREASGLSAASVCRTLSWEAHGDTYHVMATFVPRHTIH